MVNATALEIYYDYYVWFPSVGGYDLLKLGSALWSLSHQVYSHHLGPKSRPQQHSDERRMSLTDGHFDLV